MIQVVFYGDTETTDHCKLSFYTYLKELVLNLEVWLLFPNLNFGLLVGMQVLCYDYL